MNMLPKSPVNQLHEEVHIKDEPLIKNEFESSTETSNFSTHLESNTIRDLFCEQCKLQFDKKIVYDIHLKIVHKKDTIKLQDSRNDIPIETRCKPVNDISTVHEENRQPTCELCGYVPTTKNKYRERQDHLARVHFKDKIDKFVPKCRPYKCPEIDCLYVGKDNQSILRHFTGKHDILRKWLKEALSTKEIVNSSDSIQNVNSVIIEPLPKCIFCDTTFSNHFLLKEHQKKFHEGKKLHKCLTCDFKTSFKRNLVNHIEAVHEGKKPHKCWICDYSCNRKNNLKQHISKVHEGKKPYMCSICDYICYRPYTLKEHIAEVHEGKKPRKCTLCNVEFRLKVNLIKHYATIHEGKKPFKCTLCDLSFIRERNMFCHIASIHEGKKPFKCTLCNYKSSTKSNVRKHVKSSHDEPNSKSSIIQGKNKNVGNITLQIGHESFSPPSVQPQGLISCENMVIKSNNINCPKCHIELDKNDLKSHMARCPYGYTTCELCGYVPTTKNKYREKQDHLARVHFKDKIDKVVPKCRPYNCPESDCLYVGKDNQSILRHFTGKHDILKKWLKEALSTKEMVNSSDIIQNGVKIEQLPRLPTEPLPRLPIEPLPRLPTEQLPRLPIEPLSRLPTEPLPRLLTELLPSLPTEPLSINETIQSEPTKISSHATDIKVESENLIGIQNVNAVIIETFPGLPTEPLLIQKLEDFESPSIILPD